MIMDRGFYALFAGRAPREPPCISLTGAFPRFNQPTRLTLPYLICLLKVSKFDYPLSSDEKARVNVTLNLDQLRYLMPRLWASTRQRIVRLCLVFKTVMFVGSDARNKSWNEPPPGPRASDLHSIFCLGCCCQIRTFYSCV